jgi:hypothetical protein
MATEAQDHTNRLNTPHSQKFLVIPSITLFLCALVPLWLCLPSFTTVKSSLQIRLFMQNKAKFRKVKLNVNKVLTMDYENKTLSRSGKKQSQTNPNKAKFKKAKMNVTTFLTKEYEDNPPIRAPKKQSQFSKRQKPMQTSLPQRIMKNTALSASDKTNPNKANFRGKKMLLSTFLLWEIRRKISMSPL